METEWITIIIAVVVMIGGVFWFYKITRSKLQNRAAELVCLLKEEEDFIKRHEAGEELSYIKAILQWT